MHAIPPAMASPECRYSSAEASSRIRRRRSVDGHSARTAFLKEEISCCSLTAIESYGRLFVTVTRLPPPHVSSRTCTSPQNHGDGLARAYRQQFAKFSANFPRAPPVMSNGRTRPHYSIKHAYKLIAIRFGSAPSPAYKPTQRRAARPFLRPTPPCANLTASRAALSLRLFQSTAQIKIGAAGNGDARFFE